MTISFTHYNEAYAKGKVTPSQASTFTQAYGTWLGNLGETGYFTAVSGQIQKDRSGFVKTSMTMDQANYLVGRLRAAGVKTVSAQRLIDLTQQANDADRNEFAASLSTPEKTQEVFAGLTTQIAQQTEEVNDPNARQMRVVDLDKTTCKNMANLLLLSVYTGNELGAEMAATLAPDCGK